jgi:hypothetical protein
MGPMVGHSASVLSQPFFFSSVQDLRLLVAESFKNGLSTKKIFENVQKTAISSSK